MTFLSPQPITPEFLAGRREIVQNILRDVDSAIKSSSVQHYAIVGDRGFGKSSLLHYLAKEFSRNKEVMPVMISGERSLGKKQFFDELIEQFLESYTKKKNLKDNLKDKYVRALSAISSAISIASSVALPIDLAPVILAALNAVENKRKWRKYAGQAIELINKTSRENEFHTIILLDDFDILLKSLGSDFAQDLRGRLSETTNLILVSTATNVSFFTRSDQPFYNFMKVYSIGSLTQEEIKGFLIGIAERANVHYTDESIKRISSLSKGWPRYLAFLAREAALSAIMDQRSSVIKDDVERGLDNVLASLEPAFRADYDSLSVLQRAILRAVSEGCNTPSLVFEKLRIPRGSISPSLVRILEKGKLQKSGKAHYKISDPLFEEWLKRLS